MSQVNQPSIPLTGSVRLKRTVWLAALLAFAATAAIVLVVVLGGPSSDDATPVGAQPVLRSDGGPEETGIAAAVGSHPALGPSESRIAAAIGGSSPQVSSGPDESRTAASISGR